ncbi:MAG: hypothetical protein COW61_04450 [Candidatus Yonathbacteria bacterium CG17_big_fil_post_rev_8_21_14_2_50_46_19]|nr:MAG: hypothetical protein COW61_04450 [Candidatus Yonathbacteria bacterium CG17_big_fil_post_rev_8_21_14_2_50_46_19]
MVNCTNPILPADIWYTMIYMQTIVQKYRRYFREKIFVRSLVLAFLFLVASLMISFYANVYAIEHASNAVADIFLSNVRAFDVDGLFAYGGVIFWIIIIFFGLIEPRRFPFALKSIALFVLIRSIFISLTHIGPFPVQIISEDPSYIIRKAVLGADLFFSGHTGLPFLMALVFWKTFPIRVFCIVSAIFFGAVALLGHFHYSIDVLAAFFITYTIFHLASIFFKKDHILFDRGVSEEWH